MNDSLYTIESQHDGTFEVLMRDEHPVYAGHFPGQAITPGVLTLTMVRECAALSAGHRLKYKAIKNCRFVAMVRPGERLTLNIRLTSTENGEQLTADITDHNGNARLQLDAICV